MRDMERGDHKYVIRDSEEDNEAWSEFEVHAPNAMVAMPDVWVQLQAAGLSVITMEDIPFPVHGVVSSLE